jgi:hypothetical protein
MSDWEKLPIRDCLQNHADDDPELNNIMQDFCCQRFHQRPDDGVATRAAFAKDLQQLPGKPLVSAIFQYKWPGST